MKLSDFGQEMRMVPGLEFDLFAHFGPEMPPHFHASEVRQMHAQVVKCRTCDWWIPPGMRCPNCAARQNHA